MPSDRVCFPPPALPTGKLAALTARGPAGEGLQETQTNNLHITTPNVSCINNSGDVVLRAVDPAQAYHVAGHVNGVAIYFMIDTGASVSLVHADIWKEITAHCGLHLQTWHQKLIGVEGSPITVLGTATLDVSLGGITVQSDFLVAADLSSKAIIGLDFLEKHEAVINLGQRILHLKGRAITLGRISPNFSTGVNNINLKISETIELPASSGIDIMVHGRQLETTEHTWLVEATPQVSSFMVANAVVNPLDCKQGSNIPVRLVNPYSVPVTIRSGTFVAQLSRLDHDSMVSSVKVDSHTDDNSFPNSSSHAEQVLWHMVEQSDVNLSDAQQQQLYNLLLTYSEVFSITDNDFGRTTVLQHTIQTGDSAPIRQHTRRISHYQRDEVKKLIDNVLTRDIIQPSTSPWASPVVIVRKKDGSARLC